VLVLDLHKVVVVLVLVDPLLEQQALLIPEVVVVEDHILDPDQLVEMVVVDLLWFGI
jgi:hypothetical protein|tara:strand:- start:339 stop:509 length:171 start_codon:yes stop_codon:yes gene_type:complete